MKKIFLSFMAVLFALCSFSQKIADLPAATGKCSGCQTAVTQAAVTKRYSLDSLAQKHYVDSLNAILAATLSGKQATLISGTNIKTVNGNDLLGTGDINVGTITSVNTNSPLSAAGTTTRTISADTVRHHGALSTYDQHAEDSLQIAANTAAIAGKQAQLNGTGFVKVSGTTITYDNTAYGTGTLTNFSKTDGFGIISSVSNPTTTPNHTIGADSLKLKTVYQARLDSIALAGQNHWSDRGSNRISNNNTSNVGIGTTTPTALLDVAGTFRMHDGTEVNNYVLTSDASGNATWQAVAAGGVDSAMWKNNGTYTGNRTHTMAGFYEWLTGGAVKNDTLNIGINAKDSNQDIILNGTSITVGYYSFGLTHGWTSIVAAALGLGEVNHGVVGAMASDLLTGPFIGNIATKTATHKYMIFEYGTNELINNIDTLTYKAKLLVILDTALARGWNKTNLFWLPNAYMDTLIGGNKSITLQRNMRNACKNFCDSAGLRFIDIFAVGLANTSNNYFPPTSIDPNHVHPSDAGHSMYAQVVMNAIGTSVVKKSQALAVNGTTQLQNLDLQLTDTIVNSTDIVPMGYDWVHKRMVRLPLDYFIKSGGFKNPQQNPISTGQDIYTGGNLSVAGNVNLGFKPKQKSFELYYDSTAGNGNGYLFPYDNANGLAGDVMVANGRFAQGVSTVPASSLAKIYTPGTIQGAGLCVTGTALYPTGVAALNINMASGIGQIFAISSGGGIIATQIYKPLIGSSTDLGLGLQVTGNGFFTTGLSLGSTSVPTDKLEVTGNMALMTAGNKIKIATGSNASVGTATLSGGTITVNTTAVTASSKIFLTDATTGALTNVGTLTVGTITAGTSFVINSTNVLDASNVNWFIVN